MMEAEEEMASIFKSKAKKLESGTMETRQELKFRNSWVSSSINNNGTVKPNIAQSSIQRSSTLNYDIPQRPSNPQPSLSLGRENYDNLRDYNTNDNKMGLMVD